MTPPPLVIEMTEWSWWLDWVSAFAASGGFFLAAAFLGAFALLSFWVLSELFRLERPIPVPKRPELRIVRRRRVA